MECKESVFIYYNETTVSFSVYEEIYIETDYDLYWNHKELSYETRPAIIKDKIYTVKEAKLIWDELIKQGWEMKDKRGIITI